MINRKILVFLTYILGFITPIIIVMVLIILGVIPEKSKQEVILSKWRIEECNDTFLYINNVKVQTEPNIWFAMGIERDPNTRLLKRLGIVKGQQGQKEPVAMIFLYQSKGPYDKPMACYGSSELFWRDFNFDGQFDEIIDYPHKIKEININRCWIQGTGVNDVYTEKGIFRFDPNVGDWKQIDSDNK